MVGRLVEQQDVGLGRQHAGQRGAARLAARQARGVLLAGQAELVQQVARAVGIVARPEPRLDIGERGRRSRRGRAPAAGSGWSRRAGRSACRRRARSARRRSSAASTCPSRCGRRGTAARPARRRARRPRAAACRRRSARCPGAAEEVGPCRGMSQIDRPEASGRGRPGQGGPSMGRSGGLASRARRLMFSRQTRKANSASVMAVTKA